MTHRVCILLFLVNQLLWHNFNRLIAQVIPIQLHTFEWVLSRTLAHQLLLPLQTQLLNLLVDKGIILEIAE